MKIVAVETFILHVPVTGSRIADSVAFDHALGRARGSHPHRRWY
jgi:hypothetical protein